MNGLTEWIIFNVKLHLSIWSIKIIISVSSSKVSHINMFENCSIFTGQCYYCETMLPYDTCTLLNSCDFQLFTLTPLNELILMSIYLDGVASLWLLLSQIHLCQLVCLERITVNYFSIIVHSRRNSISCIRLCVSIVLHDNFECQNVEK